MCCTWLAENTGHKNYAKNRHLHTIAQLCRAVSSQLRHVSEKNLLNGNISSICLHNMVNFGPLKSEICWRVWGTPANFNRFRVLASLLQQCHWMEVNSLCIQILRSPVLAALLHGTRALASEGWVGLSGCSQTEVVYLPADGQQSSTNRAWHRVTVDLDQCTTAKPSRHVAL